MKTPVNFVIIATNIYLPLGIRLIKNINQFYSGFRPLKIHIFTDMSPYTFLQDNATNVEWHETSHDSWKEATNSKFKNILSLNLPKDDHVYYLDADTCVETHFTEYALEGDIVGAEQHNSYLITSQEKCPFDRNPMSKAYVPMFSKLPLMYYQGALFGGKVEYINMMCEIMLEWLEQCPPDYDPPHNDESYINKFFHLYPPSRTILWEDYPFIVSNKGGIPVERKFKKPSDDMLQLLKYYKNKNINIVNGNVVVA